MKLNIIELCKKISEYVGYEITYLTNMSEYNEYSEVSIYIVAKDDKNGRKTLADDLLLEISAGIDFFEITVEDNKNADLSEVIANYLYELDFEFDIDDKKSLYAQYTF